MNFRPCFAFLFIPLLSLLPLTGYSDSRMAAHDLADEQEMNAIAIRLRERDPLQGTRWRRTIENGFRTRFGMQIHPTCIDALEEQGLNRAEAGRRFELWIAKTTQTVLDRCMVEIPELGVWTRDWVRNLRRSVITCPSDHLDSAAANLRGTPMSQPFGNDPAGSGLRDLPLPVTRNLLYNPLISLSPSVLFRLSRIPHLHGFRADSSLTQILAHELFHSSEADNQSPKIHNQDFDVVAFSRESGRLACGQELVSLDRVYFLGSFCADQRNPSQNDRDRYVALLQSSQARCGINSCVSFLSEHDGPNLVGRSAPLRQRLNPQINKRFEHGLQQVENAIRSNQFDREASRGAAARVCERIAAISSRFHVRSSFRNQLKELLVPGVSTFNRFKQREAMEIPREYLNAIPAARQAMKELSDRGSELQIISTALGIKIKLPDAWSGLATEYARTVNRTAALPDVRFTYETGLIGQLRGYCLNRRLNCAPTTLLALEIVGRVFSSINLGITPSNAISNAYGRISQPTQVPQLTVEDLWQVPPAYLKIFIGSENAALYDRLIDEYARSTP